MSILPKILVINPSVWAKVGPKVEADLAAAGHEFEADTKTNVTTLLHTLETSFPDVYTAIRNGVVTAKAAGQSGGDKAVAVAEDALAIAPAIIKDIPGIKDALVAGVTTFFAAEVSDFKTVTTETITNLANDVTAGVEGTTASVATATTSTSDGGGVSTTPPTGS